MGVGVMGLGLVAKSSFGAAGLEIIKKLVGQVDFFAEKGSAGIEECYFRIKIHGRQGFGSLPVLPFL